MLIFNSIDHCYMMMIRIDYDFSKDVILIFPCVMDNKQIKTEYNRKDFINNFDLYINEYIHSIRRYVYYNCSFKNCTHYKNIKFNSNPTDIWVQISIDLACNIKCNFCFNKKIRLEESAEEKKTRKEIQDIIYKKTLFMNINLYSNENGEPFFDSYFKNEWIFANTNNLQITTNALLLDENYIKKIYEHYSGIKKNIRISVSIASFDKDNYEKIMSGALFSKAIENIKILNKFGILGTINYLINKDNFTEVVSKQNIISKFKDLGFEGCHIFINKNCNSEKNQKEINAVYDDIIRQNGDNSFLEII